MKIPPADGEAEGPLAIIVESTLDAVIVVDGDGLVVDWNDIAGRTFGWSHSEAVGRRMGDLIVPPQHRAAHEQGMERYQRTGDARVLNRRIEITAMDKAGREFPVELAIVKFPRAGATLFVGFLRDISERRNAEARLAFSEGSLRLATDAAEVGTWDLDMATGTLSWSDRTKAMFGISPDVPCDMTDFYAGLHEEDRALTSEVFAAALDPSRRTVYDVEYRTVGKEDRLVRWVAAKGRGLFDEEGRCVRAIGTAIDITARKLAEERQLALLRLGDQLRHLEDTTEMAFVAAEILGTALRASRAGYGAYEAGRDEFVVERDWSAPGTSSISGVHRLRSYGSCVEDLLRGDAVAFSDATADRRTRDHAAALAAISAHAALNVPLREGGSLVAIFFVHDRSVREWSPAEITFVREVADRTRAAIERRRAEAALLALNATLEARVVERTAERNLLANIVETTDAFVMAVDLGYFILAINKANADEFERIYGVRPVAGDNLLDLLAGKPEHQNQVRDGWAPALAGQEFTFIEDFGDPHRDRPYYEMKFNTLRNERGERIGAYNFVYDVTQRLGDQAKLAEALEALRQSQKMEAVGQLTGGIAHDFNNLLTGISGSLEMLEARVKQGRVGDFEKYIMAAQGASKRAAALTHRLLAFSRRQTLDPKATDVSKLVVDMADLIRRTVGPAITVETVNMVGLWRALVDPNQLENALLNLCINARDAMPDGGRLTIETSNKWMDERAGHQRDLSAGQYLALCVSDTGTGMTPDVIARAFDPFFTTKPIGQGTGLGLSMIYGFAKQSGGQVRIYSEPGQGTMVCIYLPRHYGPEETADVPADASRITRVERGETVLVVDDEPTVRMLVADVLSDLGYGSIEAEDGPAGLRVLQGDARIDLLITDVGLPGGMNGRQVADAARALRPSLKVLFITGYAENAAVGNGHLPPGMAVLTKPFAVHDLAVRIKELITGNLGN